jgi:hypothetical protein
LRLPTFEAGGLVLYRRLTLVVREGVVEKVFYPVFPPDSHAEDVLAWVLGSPSRPWLRLVPSLRRGSGSEQAKAKLRCIESDEVAVHLTKDVLDAYHAPGSQLVLNFNAGEGGAVLEATCASSFDGAVDFGQQGPVLFGHAAGWRRSGRHAHGEVEGIEAPLSRAPGGSFSIVQRDGMEVG